MQPTWDTPRGWRLVRSLPESVAVKLFDAGADFAVRKGGPEQLRKNLARVLGTTPEQVPDQLIKDSMRSYARYWREAFRLPSMDLVATGKALHALVEGQEHLEKAMAAGHGAVLALPHSGNWDMAGVWCVQQWGGLTSVAERLKPRIPVRTVRRLSRESRLRDLPAQRRGASTVRRTLQALCVRTRSCACWGSAIWRRRVCPVTFFGEPTRMPAGPAKLAIDTGAPLLPVHCWFTPDGWGFKIDPPIDVSGGVGPATQALADRFAVNIAAHPADWHMLQPLWRSDLSESRLARMEGE